MKFYGNMGPHDMSILQFDKIYTSEEFFDGEKVKVNDDEVFIGRFILINDDTDHSENHTVWMKVCLQGEVQYIKIANLEPKNIEIKQDEQYLNPTAGVQLQQVSPLLYNIKFSKNWDIYEKVKVTNLSSDDTDIASFDYGTIENDQFQEKNKAESDTLRLNLSLPSVAELSSIYKSFSDLLNGTNDKIGMMYRDTEGITIKNISTNDFLINSTNNTLELADKTITIGTPSLSGDSKQNIKITIPEITVNNKGIVTGSANSQLTLPISINNGTLVSGTVSTAKNTIAITLNDENLLSTLNDIIDGITQLLGVSEDGESTAISRNTDSINTINENIKTINGDIKTVKTSYLKLNAGTQAQTVSSPLTINNLNLKNLNLNSAMYGEAFPTNDLVDGQIFFMIEKEEESA